MKPNIFTYDDFRAFLKDSYAHMKATKKATSFRFLAREAGFSSSNFLMLVMKGKRNLSMTSIPKVAKALKLKRKDSEFFESLVFFNQADTAEEKTRFYQRMQKSRPYRELRQLESHQFEYFSHWYYPAIRELTGLPDFCEDADWIARRLSPSIPTRDAERALSLLVELGLLTRDKDGRLKQADRLVASGEEVKSLAISNFHHQMLQIASQAIDSVPAEQRDISGSMFTIPASRVGEIKEKIRQFRKELLTTVSSYDEPDDRLYQVNLQLIPLSEGPQE